MIREKAILCKLIRIKTSDQQLFNSVQYSARLCPNCNAKDCLTPHGSYERFLIGIRDANMWENPIYIKRVACSSCKTTHALLPDLLIPFASYSLRFLLLVLSAYLTRNRSVSSLCDFFQIAVSTLYRWIHLFRTHANLLLDSLSQERWISTKVLTFIAGVNALPSSFFLKYSFSFLQGHLRQINSS